MFTCRKQEAARWSHLVASVHVPVDRPAWVPCAVGAVETQCPHTSETYCSALKATLCPTAWSLPTVHGPAGEVCTLKMPPAPTSVPLGGRTLRHPSDAGCRTVPWTQPGSSRGGRGGVERGSVCFRSVSPRLLLGCARVNERTDSPLRRLQSPCSAYTIPPPATWGVSPLLPSSRRGARWGWPCCVPVSEKLERAHRLRKRGVHDEGLLGYAGFGQTV